MSVEKRIEWLKKNGSVPDEVLGRIIPAVAKRNLLAHGTWIRARDQRGFVKHEKGDAEHLQG